ncbi:metal-dependent hydrolase [Staphylococcus hyicus]|uniref:metal-dependent hydrolase n=1 Tax=Staphylococcus hyicus TaxID=1284 RepID=UPI00208EA854|nr:metal-dependent hydrolase [Staphylococcus hyicus]MCO4329968.1 metal-dependent hydrolase [Staphylococcus hyicus]MCO4331170.1 metal-dependent hydrolase [Staphylococcus hyicus]MCO4333467.1 metal-dependent hydrolase [Staphylococcus hyicus]MCO4336696.1 metal-dependent hydrolase [Staphylococcus hyicus]
MTGKTHSSAGLLIGAMVATHFELDVFETVTAIVIAGIASIFPDICHTKSKIGQRLKFVSFIIKHLFGHRTFTHSLLFISICYYLLTLIQTPLYYMISIICGMLSHVILDMLTPRGVRLLFPLPIRVRFPIHFKTGGLVDLSLASTFSFLTLYILFEVPIKRVLMTWI